MYEFVSNACQLHIDYVIPENSRKPSGGLMMKTIPWITPGRRFKGDWSGWRSTVRPSRVADGRMAVTRAEILLTIQDARIEL